MFKKLASTFKKLASTKFVTAGTCLNLNKGRSGRMRTLENIDLIAVQGQTFQTSKSSNVHVNIFILRCVDKNKIRCAF